MPRVWILAALAVALTACHQTPKDLGAVKMGQRHGDDFDAEHLTPHNRKIMQSAVQALLDACPEFSKWSSEIKPGSFGATAEIDAQHGLNVYTDRRGWKNYVTVSFELKSDHWAEWERKYGTPAGQTLTFYLGAGKHPGIVPVGGFETQTPVGTRVCNTTVKKPLGMFERPFVPDPAMKVIDQLK